MLTMDPKSWRLYAIPLSVCSVVLDFPPLLLGCATTAPILTRLWRSCLFLFLRTHKPYLIRYQSLTKTYQESGLRKWYAIRTWVRFIVLRGRANALTQSEIQ